MRKDRRAGTHTHTHTHIHTYIHIYIYIFTYIHIHACIHICRLLTCQCCLCYSRPRHPQVFALFRSIVAQLTGIPPSPAELEQAAVHTHTHMDQGAYAVCFFPPITHAFPSIECGQGRHRGLPQRCSSRPHRGEGQCQGKKVECVCSAVSKERGGKEEKKQCMPVYLYMHGKKEVQCCT